MVISLASMALRWRSVTSWQTSRSESGATVIGERRTWSPCRGRWRWARKVAGRAEPGEGEQDEDQAGRADHRPWLSRIIPGGSTPTRTDAAPPQYVPRAGPVSV